MFRPVVGSLPVSFPRLLPVAESLRGVGEACRACRRIAVIGLVSAAGLVVVPAHAQVTVQTIIGRAVTDDTHTAEVNNAISRFRESDVDGARNVLERIHTEDPKVPPPA